MSVNLSELNEAITTAREDRALCLASLRSILVRLKASEADLAMFAKLDGDLHELDLLQRRELEIISNGKESA